LLAGSLAGLLAAAAVAFYPPLISASGDLLSEPLGALLATSGLAATVWAIRDPGRWHWRAVLAGVLLAGTVLTRADLALLPVIGACAVAAAAWRGPAGWRDRALRATRAAAPLVAALLVVVLPWTIYASTTAGTFVPLSNGGGSNLFVGTYLPGGGTIFGAKRALADETQRHFPEHRRVTSYSQIRERDVIRTVAARRPGMSEEAALKAEGFANLRRYALGHPIEFARMMARKAWRLWGGYAVGTHRNRRTAVHVYHLALVAFGLLGLVAGLVVGRRRMLWLPAAVLLYATLLNTILVSEARHNLTLIPTLVTAGAAGWVLAIVRLREARARATRPETSTPAHIVPRSS
jgi:4-amino-4-deoxy-L-arabinose transferase-like glycosyltransferase